MEPFPLLSCGCRDLFIRKDFPQKLGCRSLCRRDRVPGAGLFAAHFYLGVG
jgi:hypothetical protein